MVLRRTARRAALREARGGASPALVSDGAALFSSTVVSERTLDSPPPPPFVLIGHAAFFTPY